MWTVRKHAERVLCEMLLSEYFGFEMAEYFEASPSSWMPWRQASSSKIVCNKGGLDTILQKDSGWHKLILGNNTSRILV